MKKKNLILYSIISTIICSVLCVGYFNKEQNIITVKNNEQTNNLNFEQDNDVEDYWENSSMEEIKTSILGYIDQMMKVNINKLEDFKREGNENKIRLYENEIERLNIILANIELSKTKDDLREAMQVRHKKNV